MTRSGISDMDIILQRIGTHKLERIFPIDNRTEERTRAVELGKDMLEKEGRKLGVNAGKAAKDAAAAAGQDAPETDPHFYMAKSHLFNALQVEKSKR